MEYIIIIILMVPKERKNMSLNQGSKSVWRSKAYSMQISLLMGGCTVIQSIKASYCRVVMMNY